MVEPDTVTTADITALSQLREAVGARFLGYVLACTPDAAEELLSGTRNLSAKQLPVVRRMSATLNLLPADLAPDLKTNAIQYLLVQVEDGRTMAARLRAQVRDDEAVPVTAEPGLEQHMAALAFDAYPAFLYPNEETEWPFSDRPNINVSRIIHQHPQYKQFLSAILSDPKIGKKFVKTSNELGHYTHVYSNVGRGGGQQLAMLPEIIMMNALRRLKIAALDPIAFVEAAVDELKLSRTILGGGQNHGATVAAKVAFTGILLPPGATLDFAGAIIREVSEADRRYAPAALKGKLSGEDAAGNHATVNYDGDVLMEYNFPYSARVSSEPIDMTGGWPNDLYPPSEIDAIILHLRFGLMLAIERESRAQLVPTWRLYQAPLESASSLSWYDPRHGVGIMPVALTADEFTAWSGWCEKLSAPHVSKIDVALSRILRAVAERREPSDLLVDSVIAWENIFGTKEGEPTFRITACLASLLEDTLEKRLALRTKLSAIYTLRSDVVHGNRPLKRTEFATCYEALDIAIRAVKILLSDRSDILQQPDGGRRSAMLLLGG
ncbi:hypothetical protein [Catellatospora sp. NPDC049609]|uniref:hypothetical protein n=1 Tax=Catellatospora sp. NPDC049609 TaxID=3155505 RepID=UPI003432DD89